MTDVVVPKAVKRSTPAGPRSHSPMDSNGWLPVPYRERCLRRRLELDRALERVVSFCRTTPDVVRALTFGSYARNRVSPWSDLDVLIVREVENATAVDLVADAYRAGLEADLIGVCAARFPGALATTPFGRSLLAEAREVYARST